MADAPLATGAFLAAWGLLVTDAAWTGGILGSTDARMAGTCGATDFGLPFVTLAYSFTFPRTDLRVHPRTLQFRIS